MINAEEARKHTDEYNAALKLRLVELYDAIDMAMRTGGNNVIWNSLNATQVDALLAKKYKVDKVNMHTHMVSW